MGDGVTFISEPLEKETEITGPIACEAEGLVEHRGRGPVPGVCACSRPDLREVTFMGAIDPHTPIAQGWLRASHRKLDTKLSTEYRPYHTHDEKQPLKHGQSVALGRRDPGRPRIVVPAGHRIALSACGAGTTSGRSRPARSCRTSRTSCCGCGPFLHDEPRDRPAAVFGGKTTLHLDDNSYVLLPVIPPNETLWLLAFPRDLPRQGGARARRA